MFTGDKNKLTRIEGWLSVIINILLFAFKYYAGIATGSIAIIADAWHTLSDSFSSILVLFGIKAARKPADQEHPFGHGRAELVTSIIIGALLGIIAYSFIAESIAKLNKGETVEYGTLAIVATVTSIVMKELLAQYAFWAGRKVKSTMLKADGWHHRSDALSSVVIMIGIFFGNYAWWIDGVLGIFVALLIGYAAFEIIRDSFNQILGIVPDKTIIDNITKICKDYGGEEVMAHHFHLHEYGDHKEMTFHIRLHPKITLDQAHDIASKIELRVAEELEITATIHMEPHK